MVLVSGTSTTTTTTMRALRMREVNGAAGSMHVRRMMCAQGHLPEASRPASHPQGFSRWNEAMGEWLEDSDDDEPTHAGPWALHVPTTGG